MQYLTWVGNLVRGDFGESIGSGGRPVGALLRESAPNTLQLNALALVCHALVGSSVGLAAVLCLRPLRFLAPWCPRASPTLVS